MEHQAGGGQPIENGHPDVHEHEIGPQFPGQPHSLNPVTSLAHDHEVGLGLENGPEPGADELLVIGEQHAGHGESSHGITAATSNPFPCAPKRRLPP